MVELSLNPFAVQTKNHSIVSISYVAVTLVDRSKQHLVVAVVVLARSTHDSLAGAVSNGVEVNANVKVCQVRIVSKLIVVGCLQLTWQNGNFIGLSHTLAVNSSILAVVCIK